jgi:hypothetical protein
MKIGMASAAATRMAIYNLKAGVRSREDMSIA